MDDRRQSGLWTQNPATGYYEKQQPPSSIPVPTATTTTTTTGAPSAGPYTYYQPPTRSTSERRSFAERSANTNLDGAYTAGGGSDPFTTAAANAAATFDTRRSKTMRDVALATHEKLVQSPEHLELVRKLHEMGGAEAGSEHFATKGHVSGSFASGAAPVAAGGVTSAVDMIGDTGPETLSQKRHVNETALPGADNTLMGGTIMRGAEVSSTPGDIIDAMGSTGPEHLATKSHANEIGAPQLRVDPDVPENLRTKPWSPSDPTSPQQPQVKSNASETVRRSSVPDRSPLQKLERETSKEEKRARLEEAEQRAIQRHGTLRHEKGRVVSDGSGRPTESTTDKYYQYSPRQVSSGSSQAMPPVERFYRATDALKNGNGNGTSSAAAAGASSEPRTFQHPPEMLRSLGSTRQRNRGEVDRSYDVPAFSGTPPIAKEPRPYHHAPEVPWSVDAMRGRGGAEGGSRGLPTPQQQYHREEERYETPPIVKDPRPYHHAPEVPRSLQAMQYPQNVNAQRMSGDQQRRSLDGARDASGGSYSGGGGGGGITGMFRSASGRYKHRLRDAGYIGAATAATAGAGAVAYEAAAVDPNQIMYEPRDNTGGGAEIGRSGSKRLQKSNTTAGDYDNSRAVAYDDDSPQIGDGDLNRTSSLTRSGSKKLQKKSGPPPGRSASMDAGTYALRSDRMGGGLMGSTRDQRAAEMANEPDPVPRDRVATGPSEAVPFVVPPQTAAGRAAREQVGFHGEMAPGVSAPSQQQQQVGGDEQRHRSFRGMFHRGDGTEPRSYQAAKHLEEWRSVAPVTLTLAELEFDKEASFSSGGGGAAAAAAAGDDTAWWEKGKNTQRSSSSRQATQPPLAQFDGPYEEEAKLFRPRMFLKCGPLLRYTGLRRDGEMEIWRGSIMIVAEDEQSDYSSVPTLRLFAQPMDLLPSLPRHVVDSGQQFPPEYEDPVAGQVKVSRTGRPLYVRPVHDIAGEVDLSREENNQGLYAATRTPTLGPQVSEGADGRQSQHITFQDKSRVKGRDGEKAGRYKDVRAVRLHTERGFTFWRWSIEIELGSQQHRVAYRINKGPALGFWVPARGETMNVMFHSCNGFSLSVDPNTFCGPDPLWRDVLNKHQSRPFHVMIGGGDQIYNDAAMRDTTLFREWLQATSPDWKHGADFSVEMQDELERFYLDRYSMWFSQGLFAMAGSQIPMVNVWDDHDIIDGYGSYPHHFMSTKVFAGLGAIAFKYYMLFQHQSLVTETAKEEPSWVLGASPGPYINELSRNVFLDLGRKVKFLGVDCRTERMRDEILSERSYDVLFDKCRAEIRSGETRHLIVLLGVPIAYPRLNFLENILTSRVMDPIKAIGRTGMLGGFVNKFDGGVEILDDLDDHWTAKHHKAERNWFIQELQELAAEKSVRVTILGGDVHLGAVGQFYTPKKFGVSKDRDHRYMPNVISSAIVNTPPPTMMADVLNKRNKVHHLDSETDEDLIPMFGEDVDGSKRNNKCLLPRRNYCTIREFQPGHTPPPTPPPERNVQFAEDMDERDDDRRYPPGSMARRTMSLTRGPANLIRRMSGSRSKDYSDPYGQDGQGMVRSSSLGGPTGPDAGVNGSTTEAPPPPRPTFHRRPTDLNEKAIRKAAAKGGAPDEEGVDEGREPGHINLEGGLDITLNMEIDQKDPVGSTQAYRLLVPALWYSGAPDINTARIKGRRGTIIDRLRGRGRKEEQDYSRSPSQSPPPPDRRNVVYEQPPAAAAIAAMQQPSRPNYGMDGTNSEARNGGTPQGLIVDQRAVAYGKGYNLSSPPIGYAQQATTHTPQQQQQQTLHHPYPPQPGYQNTSVPVSQSQRYNVQQGPYNNHRAQDEYSEGSLTSEEYVDARDRQPRRFNNKVERFFGIGDGKRDSMHEDGGGGYVEPAPAKKRTGWKIWK